MAEGKKRFFVLDLLRGLAVILMILSHTVYFFHNSTNGALLSLEKLGNTVAFTTFLLVSGAVFYIAYLENEKEWREKRIRLRKRLLVLISSYYAIAFYAEARNIIAAYGLDRLEIAFELLSFRRLPSYTEYIPPFIFFGLAVLFFPAFFRNISKKLTTALSVALALYLFGYLAYLSPTFEFLIPWKALLSGAEGYYRFPILHYSPVFIFGMFWGKQLLELKGFSEKKKLSELLAMFLAILLFLIIAVGGSVFGNIDNLFLRWPPTIPFIISGLLFAFASSVVLYKYRQFSSLPLLRDGLLIFGQNALGLFWAHIFLLHAYQMSGGVKVGSVFVFLLLFLLTLVVSIALAALVPFNFKFSLNFHKHSFEEAELFEENSLYRFSEEVAEDFKKETKAFKEYFFPVFDGTKKRAKLIRKRHILGVSLLCIAVSFLIFPTLMQEKEKRVRSSQAVSWFSDEYSYKREVVVQNEESFSNIPENKNLEIVFDHQSLIASKKSLKNGADITFVSWGKESFEEADFAVENGWGRTDTTIILKNPENIPSGQSRTYYMYYGNFSAKSKPVSVKKENVWQYKYKVSLSEETSFPFLLNTSKLWVLTDEKKMNISLETERELMDPKIKYNVIKRKEKGEMAEAGDGSFEAEVDIEKLPAGIYQVQATIDDNNERFLSQKASFFVSEPLYVTWTEDWEGYDVSNIYLEAMSRISKEHALPITHLFSPRIYVTPTIAKERQDFLTAWVKDREKKGEEIGLHLHMFYDFVESAGVVPKKSPNWGDKGDGYGSPTSNYSKDEMVKLLNKSFDLFSANGLAKPVSYRAGGWFANTETLKALDETGIKIDSSGRTSYEFGSNKIDGFWSLLATTKPYHPSASNQNLSGELSLWEVPNNGADSYWYKAEDMKNRFDQNYGGELLDEKKQVTYLSHPHWFTKAEQDRVDSTFDYIDNFKNDNDAGPVVYVTLKDIYEKWLVKE